MLRRKHNNNSPANKREGQEEEDAAAKATPLFRRVIGSTIKWALLVLVMMMIVLVVVLRRNHNNDNLGQVLQENMNSISLLWSDDKRSYSSSSSSSSSSFEGTAGGGVFRVSVNFAHIIAATDNNNTTTTTATDIVSLGPHEARITLLDRSCQNPRIWLRIEGDALLVVHLVSSTTTQNSLSGSFTLPMEGNYDLVAHYRHDGCNYNDPVGSTTKKKNKNNKQEKTHIKTFYAKEDPNNAKKTMENGVSNHDNETTTTANSMYPSSFWISSTKFPQIEKEKETSQPYIWHDPKSGNPFEEATLLRAGTTLVSREGSAPTFYTFHDLSNYELVCWIGSESARLLREVFKKFRPSLFPKQRPFKFHLYPTDSFVKPDKNWDDERKNRIRKCKHVLVSLDDLETPLSENEYRNQVLVFVNHLQKVIPDETFPIWMFTMFSESPMSPTHCLPSQQEQQQKSTMISSPSDHPCNAVLKDLFREQKLSGNFPDRVRLLDATDVSFPQLGENKENIAATIAIRIYVFVGKQVQEWRAKGQKGTVQGLVRGGQITNFDIVPYTEWS